MTNPSLQDQVNSQLSNIRWSFEKLQKQVKLTSVRDSLEDFDSKLKALPQRVQAIRNRGYPFERLIQSQAEELVKKWAPLRQSVQIQINQQSLILENALRPLEARLGQAAAATRSPAMAAPILKSLEVELKNLEDKASASESTVRGMYDSLENEANSLITHLTRLEWSFTTLEQASFKLMPTEALIMAVKAVWTRDGREDDQDPDGILYLTDQRFVFEQKEEVATKKVLFITTERKMVQQLLAEVPVALVQEIQATKQGVFKNEDHLELIFASGAPYQKMHFHLDGQNCNEWKALINRVLTGDLTKDRAVAVDQAAVEMVKNAPTICPSCGGAIKQVILRGQESIHCEYCGAVIRL
jgi:hypothetical protein